MDATIYRDVITCEASANISDVAKIIRDHRVRHVYIIEHGKLVGVLGGIDINNKIVALGKDPNAATARDVMNPVESATKDQRLEYAYAIMRNFNTFTCPVVDEQKQLLGYYKFADVCEAINEHVKVK